MGGAEVWGEGRVRDSAGSVGALGRGSWEEYKLVSAAGYLDRNTGEWLKLILLMLAAVSLAFLLPLLVAVIIILRVHTVWSLPSTNTSFALPSHPSAFSPSPPPTTSTLALCICLSCSACPN